MKSFLFCLLFLKTNRFSFSFYKTKRNHFRLYFRFRNENRSGIQWKFFGCIKCIRCRLLLAMITTSVCLSVCLSCGLTVLHCARKRLNGSRCFWGKHPGTNIVLDLPMAKVGVLPTGHGKSWNLGRPFFRPGMSSKMTTISCNFNNCTEQFCKGDTTVFIKSNYEP